MSQFLSFTGLAAALSLSASIAAAGDFSTFTPLGFSDDGRVFAFEEFGVEDGSGFPYSNIFFIDTERDTFLDETPFRVREEDETATISAVRGIAVGEALPLIQDYNLLDHPGWLAAFNPVTEEIEGDNRTIRYRAHPNLSPVSTLTLETFALDPISACAAITPDAQGFRLSYTDPDGETRTIHEDSRIPASRNCPTGYRLGGVMTYRNNDGNAVDIALLTVLNYGFEGPNGRWIAVPFAP
ncbi:DUF2259 domain-containing protein [uncultured Martelella sp.]|uniref:DUF2259 domain-containing protein n=1 Tax=uncultured Martelella sp. TaxID=392331 RepID=UPI0029C849D4|nr:DUF2259 domain-containing protein [uncultured Martelella sp.]